MGGTFEVLPMSRRRHKLHPNTNRRQEYASMIEIAGYLINPGHVAYVEPPHTYQGGTLDLKFLTEKEAAEARAPIDFHVKK